MERIYLANRVKTALLTDARVAADLRVQFTDRGRGVVTGEVNSAQQQQAVSEVLAEIPEAEEFLNRTHVRVIRPPHQPEPIVRTERRR